MIKAAQDIYLRTNPKERDDYDLGLAIKTIHVLAIKKHKLIQARKFCQPLTCSKHRIMSSKLIGILSPIISLLIAHQLLKNTR